MLEKFLTNIYNNSLFSKNDFLLLAISGGVDSVVLAHLLHTHQFQFAMAHCNFSLRGRDANEDEHFVHQLAQKYHVPCFSIQFHTNLYAAQKDISIQMAARKLRYDWFFQLMQMHHFQYLLTAHHLDDNIETILLNQMRSTGIKGLKGISMKQNYIVRPLLPFTKEDILKYAQQHQLTYRQDVSNYEDKYIRNAIRLKIIPELKNIQPNLHQVFQKNITHIDEVNQFIEDTIQPLLTSILIKEKSYWKIHKQTLASTSHIHLIAHYLLSPFQFNDEQIQQIIQDIHHKSSGKKFFSPTYMLVFDREYIFILPQNNQLHHHDYIAHSIDDLNLYFNQYKFECIPYSSSIHLKEQQIAYINFDKIQFPLKLRHKKDGDKFQMLGTHYTKKLSDILIDKKVPLFLKDKLILLCNMHDEIIWISHINLLNEKYKVSSTTQQVLKIYLNE